MARLKLLGGATLEGDAGVLAGAVARRHPLALLAVLAGSAPSPVSRSKAAGLLWPGVPEEKARRRLNATLHRVRKHEEVGDAAVRSVGDAIQLDENELWADVVEFERAVEAGDHERAVGLWGGPFLDGFRLGGSPEFEHWVDRQRIRLRTGYRRSLEALAEEAERRGDAPAASRWWRERLRDDPYDSRVTHRLMESLIEAGNPAAALRAASAHARLLEEELETEPPPEIRELVRRIGDSGSSGRDGVDVEPSVGAGSTTAGAASGREAERSGRVTHEPASLPGTPHPGPGSSRRWTVAAVVVVLVVAATAAVSFVRRAGPGDRGAEERSVAVLPLDHVGPPGEHAFLAEAMTEEITSALSEVPELVVKSRTSASRFPTSGLTVREFARALGVRHVIEGSVQRHGDRVRISVQLIDARTDDHVWTETYERAITDLFEVQVDVARRVADRLAATFSERERARILASATGDPVAYELYLRAGAAGDLDPEARIALLRRALDRDPEFWPAWGRLASLYLERDSRGEGARWADSARVAYGEAIQHADSSHVPRLEAYRALIFGGDEDATLARLRAAAEHSPSDVSLVAALGELRLKRGRLPEAARWLRRAARLDPLDASRWQALFPAYWWAGLYGPAERVLHRARTLDPASAGVWRQYNWLWLAQERRDQALAAVDSMAARGARDARLAGGLVHWFSGDPEAAADAFAGFDPDRVPTIPSYLPVSIAATMYAVGDSARARTVVDRFRAVLESQGVEPFDPEWRVFPRLQLAALEGDEARAVELFRTYVERGGRDHHWFHQSPLFADLRANPAFRRELSALETRVEAMRREMERDLAREDEPLR